MEEARIPPPSSGATTITDNSRQETTYNIESNDPEAVADAIQKRQEDQRRTRIGARGRQLAGVNP